MKSLIYQDSEIQQLADLLEIPFLNGKSQEEYKREQWLKGKDVVVQAFAEAGVDFISGWEI